MSCACLKNDFNLAITNTDCKSLLLEDTSIWMETEEGFFTSGNTLPLIISPMSLGKSFTTTLKIGVKNKFSSLEVIGIADKCLPDDLLCFSTTSCGVSYSITRAYLCSTYCKIEQLKAKAKNDVDWAFIRNVKSLAEQVETNAKFGKVETATELLKLLNKYLKNIQCGSCQ